MRTLARTRMEAMPIMRRCGRASSWYIKKNCGNYWARASSAAIRLSLLACILEMEKSSVRSRSPRASRAGTNERQNVGVRLIVKRERPLPGRERVSRYEANREKFIMFRSTQYGRVQEFSK